MYLSTRSDAPAVDAATAILAGIAPDGGLYVPQRMPAIPRELLERGSLSYSGLAFGILSLFLPDFESSRLHDAIEASVARFDSAEVVPLLSRGGYHFLELFHGPTLAFKDLALTLMGGLVNLAREKRGVEDELVILVATSGDTGKAALAGFSGLPGFRVVVFYPAHGISAVQRLQMVSHDAANTSVVGIEGSFDDAQRGVKALFGDSALTGDLKKKGIRLSSANSINVARLLPQIVYYVKAWRDLRAGTVLGPGETMDVAVPTGNFGNILAARYAKAMGLPIRRLICASNRNRVLADFLSTRRYDRNRPFFVTTSPSMDILVSSNLERMLFEAARRDHVRTAELMASLAREGSFALSEAEAAAFSDFRGGWAGDTAAAGAIRRLFEGSGYLVDPHTAVALSVAERLRDPSDPVPIVVAATASPFKFPRSVAAALGWDVGEKSATQAAAAATEDSEAAALAELDLAERLARSAGLELPLAVRELRDKPTVHHRVIAPQAMRNTIVELLERR